MGFLISNFVNDYRERSARGFEGRDTLTPVDLARAMGGKLFEQLPDDPEKLKKITFVDPACGTGIFGAVVADYLNKRLEPAISDSEERIRHIVREQIWMYDKSLTQVKAAQELFPDLFKSKIIQKNTLNEEWPMKFDVAIGNPPFQKQVGPDKTEPVWHHFVNKCFESVQESGFISLIHPAGWRAPSTRFDDQKRLLMNSDMKYLSVNTFEQGRETFGAGTTYDSYVTKKKSVDSTSTEIEFSDGSERQDVNITELPFIPFSNFDEIQNLLAGPGEESVDVLYQRSIYGTDKDNMKEEKSSEFTYPCVYTVTQSNGVKCWYSSEKKEEHFGTPKVFWSNGAATYPVIDEDGEYGLTQFAYGIAAEPEVLPKIKKALESEEFIELMSGCRFTEHRYSRKVINILRKDFWKEFVDEK